MKPSGSDVAFVFPLAQHKRILDCVVQRAFQNPLTKKQAVLWEVTLSNDLDRN